MLQKSRYVLVLGAAVLGAGAGARRAGRGAGAGGVYTGSVAVDKPLTLRGAQRGVDARAGRGVVAAGSVIDGGGAAGIRITGTTSGVTVDGFTIRNSGTAAQNADGIEAFGGGSGFTFTDNVITQTTYGINLSSSGAAARTVAHNAGGSGVVVCCGPGNDLTIADNLFTGHGSAAVKHRGRRRAPVHGAADRAQPEHRRRDVRRGGQRDGRGRGRQRRGAAPGRRSTPAAASTSAVGRRRCRSPATSSARARPPGSASRTCTARRTWGSRSSATR